MSTGPAATWLHRSGPLSSIARRCACRHRIDRWDGGAADVSIPLWGIVGGSRATSATTSAQNHGSGTSLERTWSMSSHDHHHDGHEAQSHPHHHHPAPDAENLVRCPVMPNNLVDRRRLSSRACTGITRASGTGSAAPDAARCGTPTPRDTRTPPDRLSIAATGAQVASWRDALP